VAPCSTRLVARAGRAPEVVPVLALQEAGRARERGRTTARRDDEHADKEARHADGPQDDERPGEGPELRRSRTRLY
jgi:hypothetical protein